jgi:hypothetical protein
LYKKLRAAAIAPFKALLFTTAFYASINICLAANELQTIQSIKIASPITADTSSSDTIQKFSGDPLTLLLESGGILATVRLLINLIGKPFEAIGGGSDNTSHTPKAAMSLITNSSKEDDDQSWWDSLFDSPVPTPFPYNNTDYAKPLFAITLGGLSLVSFIANLMLFSYIMWQRLYHNFISSHFIAHLCVTNMIGLLALVPMISYSMWTGHSFWLGNEMACRVQAFFTCSIWSVVHYMVLCIAGVHVLTFARIHYDQLFGLPPLQLCILSWLVAFAVSLPCITNGHIVIYDPVLRMCLWGKSDSSYKFLTYFIILGVVIPTVFTYYAYLRVLRILYHSPIVFQSIGLYKSRIIVYTFLLYPVAQIPFYTISIWGTHRFEADHLLPLIAVCLCFLPIFISPVQYAISLVQVKEEDMALTARAHKGTNAYQHVNSGETMRFV